MNRDQSAPAASGQKSQSGARGSTQDSSGGSGMSSGTGASGSSGAGTTGTGATASSPSATSITSTTGTVTSSMPTFTKGKVNMADRKLIRDLAQTNLAEIEAAKLAQSKTTNEQVRTFAQHMVDDHTRALQQVQQLAEAKEVQLPTEPTAKQKRAAKKLAALSGEEFDREYLGKAGVNDHRAAERLVSRISTNARDSDLKNLATNLLPTMQKHLQMATQTQGSAQTSSGSSGASRDTNGASGSTR